MAGEKKSYVEEVAPWPTDSTITADALVKHYAAATLALSIDARHYMHLEYTAEGDEAKKAYLEKYIACLDCYLGMAQVAHAIRSIQKTDPDRAEQLAKEIFDATEDGGWYSEICWDWLEDLGIDPQRIQDETEAALAAEESK